MNSLDCLNKSKMKTIFSTQYHLLRQTMITARKKANLTQTMVAQAINKPQSFVAKYENGERRLDIIEFVQIAHVIGIDPCEIIRKIEKEMQNQSYGDSK